KDHPSAGQLASYSARSLKARETRHSDIHQHNVWSECHSSFNSFAAVARFADDLHVRLALQDAAQALAKQRMVIDDETSNGHCQVVPRLLNRAIERYFNLVVHGSEILLQLQVCFDASMLRENQGLPPDRRHQPELLEYPWGEPCNDAPQAFNAAVEHFDGFLNFGFLFLVASVTG